MIIYTGGSFDLLHVGHLELLGFCRLMAGDQGRVVVSLNRDEFIGRYKARPPVQTYDQRAEMLRSCRFVDLVVCNVGDENSGVAIEVVHPDLLVIGDDWQDKDYLGQLGITQEWLNERHLRVSYVPRTRGVSTSGLRDLVGSSGGRRLE